MNSKQRVLATIDHVEPDRVPVDLWALSPVTDNLRVHFSVDDPATGFPRRSLSRAKSRGSGQAVQAPSTSSGRWERRRTARTVTTSAVNTVSASELVLVNTARPSTTPSPK
jgi:hypothetical protein